VGPNTVPREDRQHLLSPNISEDEGPRNHFLDLPAHLPLDTWGIWAIPLRRRVPLSESTRGCPRRRQAPTSRHDVTTVPRHGLVGQSIGIRSTGHRRGQRQPESSPSGRGYQKHSTPSSVSAPRPHTETKQRTKGAERDRNDTTP